MKPNSFLYAVAFGLTFGLTAVEAHELRPGYLQINEATSNSYDVVWKAPMTMGRPLAVEPVFPDGCATTGLVNRSSRDGSLTRMTTLECVASLQGQRIDLNGLDATFTDVLVRVQLLSGEQQTLRATPDAPMIEVMVTASTSNVAGTYFLLGVEHILSGIDHLLFVLALIILICGVRRLVATITAFTVAHSITLIIASLGWVSLPAGPIEAVIALSIVFLAQEIATKPLGSVSVAERFPWLVAFLFGLLHGFGFAGALAEIGYPQNDIPTALFSFNLGVEAGQLIFLAGALTLLALINRLQWRQRFDMVASYAIGTTACVWLLERTV